MTKPTYIHRYGNGQHVYIGLHGWAADHTTFETLSQHMHNTSLYSVDLPGYGESAPLSTWTFESLKQALVDVIKPLEHDNITLIGSCSGAVLALAALDKEIDALGISRLVLLEPFAFVPGYLDIFLKPVIGKVAFWSTFCNPIGRAITDMAIKRQNIAQEHGTNESFAKVDPWVPYHYLQLMANIPSPDQFSHLQCEIDLIHGQLTFEAITDSVKIWQKIWPHAKTQQLNDVGHMLIQEAPAMLAKAIQKAQSS